MLDKLLAKIRERFSGCPCFKEGGCLCADVDPNKIMPVKLPILKMMFAPFSLLLDNGKNFFMLAIPFALLIGFLAMITGFGYMCIYSQIVPVKDYCSESGIVFMIYNLAKIFLWSIFAIKWSEISFLKQPLDWKSILRVDRRNFKLTALIVLIIALNFLPMVSGWILYLRVPNPDWRIEILFFAVISIGFIVPFIVMRFYSVIAYVIYGNKVPSLKEIWYKTAGNTLIILLGLFLVFVLSVFILGNLYSNFQSVAADGRFYISVASEFIYNLIVLMILTVIINSFCLQQQLLFGDSGENKNE